MSAENDKFMWVHLFRTIAFENFVDGIHRPAIQDLGCRQRHGVLLKDALEHTLKHSQSSASAVPHPYVLGGGLG